ncbi:hypothetical protein CI102_8178 [Trichoderma harzianum]|nr:hypothetical protein CI102_8178 [Trichoderma harzianum]
MRTREGDCDLKYASVLICWMLTWRTLPSRIPFSMYLGTETRIQIPRYQIPASKRPVDFCLSKYIS